jgi:hypothetical protein
MQEPTNATDIQHRVSALLTEARERIAGVHTVSELDGVRRDVVGRNGSLLMIRRSIGALDEQARRSVGAALNEAQREITDRLAIRRPASRIPVPRIRTSLPAPLLPGRRHTGGRQHHPLDHACGPYRRRPRSGGPSVSATARATHRVPVSSAPGGSHRRRGGNASSLLMTWTTPFSVPEQLGRH